MALDSLAGQLSRGNEESVVYVETGPTRRADFNLDLENPEYLGTELYERLCALPPQYGIDGQVEFAVTSWIIDDSWTEHPVFTCRAGRLIR